MAITDKPKDKSKETPQRAQPSRTSTNPRTPARVDEQSRSPRYVSSPLSISGIRGGVVHSVFMKVVLGLLIAIFALGVAFTGIGGGPGGNDPNSNVAGSGPDPVAVLGSENIPRSQFQRAYAQRMQFNEYIGQQPGPADLMSMRQQVLQSLADDSALVQEAQRQGFTVTDAEIDQKIASMIEDRIKSERGENEAAFRRQVEASHGSLATYQDALRKDYDREAVERVVLLEKLENRIKDQNKVTEDDYKKSVTKLKLRQIVARPRLPVPPPKSAGKDPKTIKETAQQETAQEVKARAEKIVAQLKQKPTIANFIATAKKESDDAVTKTKGGDLGWKLPTEIYEPSSAREALMNATSPIVGPLQEERAEQDQRPKDLYIFLIETRKLKLPADYAKKKAELIKTYETQRDNEVWGEYRERITKAAQVEIHDPVLQAYKIQTEQANKAAPAEQQQLFQTALEKYQEGLNYASASEATAIHYQMAQLHRSLNQPDKAIESLQAAVKGSGNTAQARLELAQSLREQKKNKEALTQLNELSKQLDQAPAQPSFGGMGGMMGGMSGDPSAAIRFQAAAEYEELGHKNLAEAERKKAMPPAPPSAPPALGGVNSGSKTIKIPSR